MSIHCEAPQNVKSEMTLQALETTQECHELGIPESAQQGASRKSELFNSRGTERGT